MYQVDDQRAVKLVTEMMTVPGKSGEEAAIAELITEKLVAAGVQRRAIVGDQSHKKSPVGGERGNLIVRLPGTVRGPRRLMMAHMDTVPLCVGANPVRQGNRITASDPRTALGADNRAGAAVVLNALLEIKERDLPHPPLTLFWPVQEENGMFGARYASHAKLGSPKLCFNWDGNSPEMVCVGATGDYAIKIEVEGIASHAGVHPEQGVSAAVIAAKAIADLEEGGWLGLVEKGRKTGSSNIGVLSGGAATNVVMPTLSIRAEVRSHDPKFRKRMLTEFEKAFQSACKTTTNDVGKTGQVSFQADLKYESFRLQKSEPIVQSAMSALAAVGLKGYLRVTNGGLDANWMTSRGLPTVTFGCGQMNPHTVNEALDVEAFLQACRVGLAVATGG